MAVNADAPEGLDDRAREMYQRRYVERWTMQRIADEFGVSQQRVSQILAGIKHEPVDLEAIRQRAAAMHERVQAEAWALVEMRGAPVTSGKDGSIVFDPEDQTIVRDYALRLAALKVALEADREIRKLYGADAASKVESTATVRYEVVGVDPADLT